MLILSTFQTLNSKLHTERERLVLWLPVCLGAGIGLYFRLNHEPPLWLLMVGVGVTALLIYLARRHFLTRLLSIALTVIMMGMVVASLRTHNVQTPVIYGELFFKELSGTVDDVQQKEKGVRLLLSTPAIEGLPPRRTPNKVTVTFKNDSPDVSIGDRVTAKAMLFAPPTPSMPGGYDFTRAFFFEGIGAVGFSPSAPISIEKGNPDRFEEKLNALRLRLAERIAKPMQAENAPVATAMMVGEQSAVSEEVSDAMRDAGIYHVLSISGLHMSLAAGLLYFSVRFLLSLWPSFALRMPVKKITAGIGLLGASAYLLLAGYPVPAIRSFVMVACVMLAVIFDRRGISLYSLAWAAVIILLWQPESLLGVSFQMSFAATIAILALYERFSPSLFNANASWLKKLWLYFLGLMATSLAATLATTPLVIYNFNRFTVLGIIANMLMVPLASFWIMPACVLAFLTMPFGLEQYPLALLDHGISLMLSGSKWIASFPHASFFLPSLTFWGMLMTVFGGLWLCLWQARWRIWGILFIVLGTATILLFKPYDLLISDDATKVMLRLPDNEYVFLRGRPESFDGQQWLRAHGQEEALTLARYKKMSTAPACDKNKCIVEAYGKRIAVGLSKRRREGLCDAEADILITDANFAEGCPGIPLVIDQKYLALNGAVAIRFTSPMEMDTAESHRGMRPWVARRDSPLYQSSKPDIKAP